ncbi:g10474 [Coccomyxa viridis]|uniref:G10474 protein n=1 Tax=Coccomyxa viridis TaxID=1274662 RepID=A0ABP1GA02_9CHLO
MRQSALLSNTKVCRRPFRSELIVCRSQRSTDTAVEGLKSELKRAVANTRRGKKATVEQQKEILRRVMALEAQNPTKDPASSPLLSGNWSLLYTGPGKDDDETWEKRTGGVEGPVLAALRPLSANAVSSRGITQVIDAEGGTVQNVADFRIANSINGYLNVEGTVAPVEGSGEAVRVDVKFTAFCLKIGALPQLKVPLGWSNPTGWVDTTYLDNDTRIGRGDKGSVFVTARKGTRADLATDE